MPVYLDLNLNTLEKQIDLIVHNLSITKKFTVKERIILKNNLSKIAILKSLSVSNDIDISSQLYAVAIDKFHTLQNAIQIDLNCIPTIDRYIFFKQCSLEVSSVLDYGILKYHRLEKSSSTINGSLTFSILDYSNFIGRSNIYLKSDLKCFSIVTDALLNKNHVQISSSMSSLVDSFNSLKQSSISLATSLDHKVVKLRPMNTLTGSFEDYKKETLCSLSYMEV